jgi:tRNA threonylcarbamoyladenosine biosynthesis protein TsaB
MNDLFLDSAAGALSFAIRVGGKILVREKHDEMNRMAEEAVPLLKAGAEKAGLSFSSFDRIFVTAGPGSYTGERIALTIAKTYAFLNKKTEIYLASTLSVMSAAVKGPSIPLLDARNRAYFTGLYEDGKNLIPDQRAEEAEVQAWRETHPQAVLVRLDPHLDLSYFPGAQIKDIQMSEALTAAEAVFVKAEDNLKIKPIYLRGKDERS